MCFSLMSFPPFSCGDTICDFESCCVDAIQTQRPLSGRCGLRASAARLCGKGWAGYAISEILPYREGALFLCCLLAGWVWTWRGTPAPCVSGKVLRTSAHFRWLLSSGLLWSHMSSLCILGLSPLSDTGFANNFSHLVSLPFHLVDEFIFRCYPS